MTEENCGLQNFIVLLALYILYDMNRIYYLSPPLLFRNNKLFGFFFESNRVITCFYYMLHIPFSKFHGIVIDGKWKIFQQKSYRSTTLTNSGWVDGTCIIGHNIL